MWMVTVDANLRQLTTKPLSQECSLSNAGSDVSAPSPEPRRRKEVSFSLDEENNFAGSAGLMLESAAAGSLEAIPEMKSQVDSNTTLGVVRYRPDVKPVSCAKSGTCAKSKENRTSLSGILRAQLRLHSREGKQNTTIQTMMLDNRNRCWSSELKRTTSVTCLVTSAPVTAAGAEVT
ncbi:hypothetical protein ACOMHN_031224 [Nucella lapillus]